MAVKKPMTDSEIRGRIEQLYMWVREGRKFPNNYRNIEVISKLSVDLVDDLVAERAALIKENKRLKAEK